MSANADAQVYRAINKVQAALAKSGIAKDRKNEQQHYQFRGIDDVYNALAPLLAEHGLCVLPRMMSREATERQTRQGGALFSVTVEAEFDFIAAADGSKHTVRTFGEAMDSGDKATNKAMSAAYKYALIQSFAIPTNGDNDADAVTHDVAARRPASAPATSSAQARPPQKPTAKPSAPQATGDTEVWSGVTVQFLDEKPTKNGGVMVACKFSNGQRASTFDAGLGAEAKRLKAAHATVDVVVTKKGDFYNIAAFAEAAGDDLGDEPPADAYDEFGG